MSYTAQNIRNICLVGHGGNGKTSLAESMLFLTGGTDRLGKVPDGNTVCDYDPEEIKRKISISLTLAPVEYKNCKINVLDTPGYFDFAGEVAEALRVTDAAVIVIAAKGGLNVGAERMWKQLVEQKKPRIIYVSRADEENSDFYGLVDALREKYGPAVCPTVIPIVDETKRATAVLDVVSNKAYEIKGNKRVEIPVPAGMQDRAAELRDKLFENVAETSEEFMEKYFSGETFTAEEIAQGIRAGVRDLSLVPVICGSASTGLGTTLLLDAVVALFPNPLEGVPEHAGETEVPVSPEDPLCAFVFKTVSDQYGKFSCVKVVSGTLAADSAAVNARTGSSEKLGRLYSLKGKKSEEIKSIPCGDIGAIAKMTELKTGDSLCDPKRVLALDPIPFAKPCYSMAIAPKS